MPFCINCGRSYESEENYCSYCGTKLRDRIINFETTNTLLRSNVIVSEIKPVRPVPVDLYGSGGLKKNAPAEERTSPATSDTAAAKEMSSSAGTRTERNSASSS